MCLTWKNSLQICVDLVQLNYRLNSFYFRIFHKFQTSLSVFLMCEKFIHERKDAKDGELSFPSFSPLFHPSVLVLCLNKLLWHVLCTSSLLASKPSFNNLVLAHFSFAYEIDFMKTCVCVCARMHAHMDTNMDTHTHLQTKFSLERKVYDLWFTLNPHIQLVDGRKPKPEVNLFLRSRFFSWCYLNFLNLK